MYKLLRAVLFLFDAERVHYFSMNALKILCRVGVMKKLIRRTFTPKTTTPLSIFNIQFPNKVGLAAGFDKNAIYLNELETLGFGFVEIGTVTPLPQQGNDRPRLFRLPKDKALINRMGFNNDGVEVVAGRLKQWREKDKIHNVASPAHGIGNKLRTLIVGGNIGKNKTTPNEEAWQDYITCFNTLYPYVDYFVVNVSSPNTPGLRELQEKDALRKIITSLQRENRKHVVQKPVFLKIAPDLGMEQIDEVIALAIEIQLDGLIAANTTIGREHLLTPENVLQQIGAGGLSGPPLASKTRDMVGYISKKTNNRLCIIASGGIFTATDAKENLRAGASLVQVWTGFIYEGPAIVKNICNGL